MDFLGALLRGDLPLAKVYWVYGVIGGFLFLVLPGAFAGGLQVAGSDNVALATLSLFYRYGFAPAYVVFISVAIWRSATNYQGNPLWAKLAKAAVVLGVLDFALEIAGVF